MRPARSTGVLVLATLGVLAACSSDKSSSNAFIEQYCSLLRPCCAPSSSGGEAGSGCVSFYGLFGGGSIDAATSDACLAEIHAHQSEMTFCSNVAALTPSCDKAFSSATGTKAPGEACSTSRECARSAEGKVSCAFGSGNSSICQLVIDGKPGDAPCIGTRSGGVTNGTGSPGPTPPRGFVCDLAKDVWCNAKSGACEATRKIGDACLFSETSSCGAGAECGSAGKCVASTPSTGTPSMDPSLIIVCSTVTTK